MSNSELVHIEPLLLDGLDYFKWSTRMLTIFRTLGHQIERVVDMSISPPSDKFISFDEEEKCIYLNAQATNTLFNILSEDVFETIRPHEDANLIWTTFKQRYDKPKWDEEVLLLETSFGESSTSSSHHEVH